MPELGSPILSRIVCSSSLGNLLAQTSFNLVAQAAPFLPRAIRRVRARASASGRHRPAGRSPAPGKNTNPIDSTQKTRKQTANSSAVLERGFQQRLVAAAEIFELPLESPLEASRRTTSALPLGARGRA